MTAKQILDFAEQYAHEKDMFGAVEDNLQREKFDVFCKLEQEPNNKKLYRQYVDICEKLRMLCLMRNQRLELFYQSNI